LGTTLCIQLFYLLHREALDYKTPLLRALQVMDEAATDVCKYFDKKRKLLLLRMGTRVLF
jgi:glutamine synthetase